MWGYGRGRASSARERRLADIVMLLCVNSLHRMKDSSTSTPSDHFLYVKVNRTCWRVLSTCTTARTFLAGWVARWSSRKTEDASLNLKYSENCRNFWAPRTSTQQQANDMLERLLCSWKSSLRAELTNTKWLEHLPPILQGLRTMMKKKSNCSMQKLCMEPHCGFKHNISLTNPPNKKL